MGYVSRGKRVVFREGTSPTAFSDSISAIKNTFTTMKSVSGRGLFYLYHIHTTNVASSHALRPVVTIDGNRLYSMTHTLYNQQVGGTGKIGLIQYLQQYGVDDFCSSSIYTPWGLAFSETLVLEVQNTDLANDVTVAGNWLYTLV